MKIFSYGNIYKYLARSPSKTDHIHVTLQVTVSCTVIFYSMKNILYVIVCVHDL